MKRNMHIFYMSRPRTLLIIPLLALLTTTCSSPLSAQLDETWTLTVGGQTVRPNPNSTFRISNISSIDATGLGGAPDFLSDDLFRVEGVGEIDGVPHYVYSEPFRILNRSTYRIQDLVFTTDPPPEIIASIRADGPAALHPGDVDQWSVTAINPAGSERPITAADSGTVYVSSRREILSVGVDGEISAVSPGIALVSIRNQGVTAVKRVEVLSPPVMSEVEGFVQFEDGTPVLNAVLSLENEVRASSDNQGFFYFNFEGAQGPISLSASFSDQDNDYRGRSELRQIVPNGLTDAGIIVVRRFEIGNLFPHPTYLETDPARSSYIQGRVALGDFNRDGRADVAMTQTVNAAYGELVVQYAAESGRLDTTRRYGDLFVTASPLDAGDLDGDQDLDMVEAAIGGLKRWDNNGIGEFTPNFVDFQFSDIRALRVFDLNNDGLADAIFSQGERFGRNFHVALNNSGSFNAGSTAYSFQQASYGIEFADMDDDDDIDIVALTRDSNNPATIEILTNNGEGLFQLEEPILLPDVAISNRIAPLAIVEATGDTAPDFATTTANSGSTDDLLLYANTGSGTGFQLIDRHPGVSWVDLAGDLDLDGDADLVTRTVSPALGGTSLFQFTVFENNIGSLTRSHDVSTHPRSQFQSLADIDGDGLLDIVRSGLQDGYSLLMSSESEGFIGEDYLFLQNPAHRIVAGDLDGDGDQDVLATSGSSSNVLDVSVLLNDQDGLFCEEALIPVGSSINRLGVQDLDGNGSLDIVCLTDGPSELLLFSNRGQGVFDLLSTHPVGSSPLDVEFLDVDENGLVDVVVGTTSGVLPLLQTTTGVFSLGAEFPTTGIVRNLVVCDVTDDGRPDLVTAQDELRVLTALGGGSFFEEDGMVALSPNSPLGAGDLNGDGDCDIVVGNGFDDTLMVFINNSGMLVHDLDYSLKSDLSDLDLFDVDDDGTLDIVGSLLSSVSSTVVFRNPMNTGELKVEFYGGTLAGAPSFNVVIVDADQDGHWDLVTTHRGSNVIGVLRNQLPD